MAAWNWTDRYNIDIIGIIGITDIIDTITIDSEYIYIIWVQPCSTTSSHHKKWQMLFDMLPGCQHIASILVYEQST